MLLNNEQIEEIMRELRIRMDRQKMGWYTEAGKVRLTLPNRVAVELSQGPDHALTVAIQRNPDEVLGSIEVAVHAMDDDCLAA